MLKFSCEPRAELKKLKPGRAKKSKIVFKNPTITVTFEIPA